MREHVRHSLITGMAIKR